MTHSHVAVLSTIVHIILLSLIPLISLQYSSIVWRLGWCGYWLLYSSTDTRSGAGRFALWLVVLLDWDCVIKYSRLTDYFNCDNVIGCLCCLRLGRELTSYFAMMDIIGLIRCVGVSLEEYTHYFKDSPLGSNNCY